jgi:hypothetical protein
MIVALAHALKVELPAIIQDPNDAEAVARS